MKKEKGTGTCKEFPQKFDLEELVERFVFVEKVEKGLQQVEEDCLVHDEG